MATVRYDLTTAPEWVPRPRQDADGRYLSARRQIPICPDDHPPARLAYSVRHRQGRPQTGAWVCRDCLKAKEAGRYPLRRSTPPPPPKLVADEPPGGWTPRHPFDFTRVRLEQEWGVPYAAWTMAQHREHTRTLYHLLGWGDAAIKEAVIYRDAKNIIHRRSA
jgi:hypothetical protein